MHPKAYFLQPVMPLNPSLTLEHQSISCMEHNMVPEEAHLYKWIKPLEFLHVLEALPLEKVAEISNPCQVKSIKATSNADLLSI